MDLRLERTKENIYNAFFQLRENKDVNEISVVELSKIAKISKQTFYTHYRDIFELAEIIEEDFFNNLFKNLNIIDILENITIERLKFIHSIFIDNLETIKVIYSKKRNYRFNECFYNYLKKQLANNSSLELKKEILIIFSIYGGYYSYYLINDYKKEEITFELYNIISKLKEM